MGGEISKASYFELINNTNRDIINTSISSVDNYDWDGDYRPDHNLVGRKIPRGGGSIREYETVNARANHCPFNMILEFSDGTKDGIRVHQSYATLDCEDLQYVFQHFNKSHEISYRRSGSQTLVVTVENTPAQKKNERAEQENKKGEEAMRIKMYHVAVRKFEAAKSLANEWSTINTINANLKRAENADKANKLHEEGKELLKQEQYNSAINKFDKALKLAQSSMSEDITVDKKKALNARAEELIGEGEDAMKRKSYTFAMEKFDEALVIANDAYTIKKIAENRSAVRTALYRQRQDEDALKINNEGEKAFAKGEYETAIQKFREAYGLSNEMSTIDLSKRNLSKATRAQNAREKNEDGNQLVKEKKYEAAIKKFDEALELAEGSLISANIDNNKREALNKYGKALYDEGWRLESDEIEDGSMKAQKIFSKVRDIFTQTKLGDSLKLVELKIVGNQVFNDGANIEQEASKLYENAKRSQMIDDFTSAQQKYEFVLERYKEAKKKFEEGASVDQKFSSSVSFVNDQIVVVKRKVEKIEEEKLNGEVRNVSFDTKTKNREDNEVTNTDNVKFVSD